MSSSSSPNAKRIKINRARGSQRLGIAAHRFKPRQLADPVALPQRFGEHLVELIFCRERHRQPHRPTHLPIRFRVRCNKRIVDRIAQQASSRRIIQDRKSRRHVRFERKSLQQALAERVDRLHLQPTRRFDRPRE